MNFHHKALLAGGITALLCFGVIFWTFVIDKGTLVLTGDSNYEVEISGARLKVPQNINCAADPCEVKLLSGTYSVIATKDGYFNEGFSATVKRRNNTEKEIDFDYVPTLSTEIDVENVNHLFATEELESDLSFVMDETYNKQKLMRGEEVLAYFDRELQNPASYESRTGRFVLAADQGEDETTLYLVDTEESSRSLLGDLSKLTMAKWSLDDEKLLLAEGNILWIVETSEATFEEWAFEFDLEKAVWGAGQKIYFATNKNLEAFIKQDPAGSVDVLKSLLSGEFSELESVSFSVGSYDVEKDDFAVIYEVPSTREMDYEKIELAYDDESGKLYFTDGIVVFEVVTEG
jgi:hypothetical protein